MTDALDNLFSVKDKVVFITGGGGVLCGAMAAALGQRGAKVAVADLMPQAAEKVVAAIAQQGGDAMAVQCDVLDKASVQKAVDSVIARFGRIDILVNGAGGNKKEATTGPDKEFFDLPAEAVRWVFDLNFIGTFLPSQVVGRHMAKRGDGVIINISSMNAFTPLTKIPAYSAAKAAVSNFTQWLAVHMSQNYSKDIRVNAIAPGFFCTTQNKFLLYDEKTGELSPRGKTIIDHTPMSRFGAPEDLVSALLWLVSPGGRFVHGTVVAVDGGFSAFSGV
ncbi:MAG TPA: SDR family oxidoreductase [Candidatus Brocadiia bacterium]|nr:SDR family oxidoreductase [Candidatus Brocadiia bacterium]